MDIFQVDAFAKTAFSGNPAAVMALTDFLTDKLMQDIAAENNLSETAYVVPRATSGHYDLRWFTPTVEIKFCGHATIASAHVLATELGHKPPFTFHTQIGELIVSVTDGLYNLDAPIYPARPTELTEAMTDAFPAAIAAFHASDNLFLVVDDATDIGALEPDMAKIIPLSDHGVGITAAGTRDYDCVSRFFVPAQGIDEDPVTGSAHAAIGPYWAKKLGKSKLTAYQASARGGELYLDIGEIRLTISGHAVTYMRGTVTL